MRKFIKDTAEVILPKEDTRFIVFSVGAATFFFGFAAGAIVNIYLLSINSSLVTTFRASLTYVSSIIGDGIVLPIVNMIIVSFLLVNREKVTKKTMRLALFFGLLITLYFHINQAVNGLVNWTMPMPWHWNILGVWHAGYMFTVASLISCFYLVLFKVKKRTKRVPREALIVTLGIALFLTLLRLDYSTVSLCC